MNQDPSTLPLMDQALGVKYRFFGRKNGVSKKEFASLNCSVKVGDTPACVRENMRRIALNLGCSVEKIFTLHQTHSSIVHSVLSEAPFEKIPYGDALVTNQPNIFLGIKTADCAPVLFADPVKRIVGIAHAGWRGAVAGVLENTVQAMLDLGAEKENIIATIGPCIAPQSYEVGKDMFDEFLNADIRSNLFFVPIGQEKYRFDLPGYILTRLEHSGIGVAEWIATDTYTQEKEYFSHRRSSQRSQLAGRQLSVIGLLDLSLF